MKRHETFNQWLARQVYGLAYRIDEARNKVDSYDYETAPYCGHHYDGHDGWLTTSGYHEGDGGCHIKSWFLNVHHHTEEGWYIGLMWGRLLARMRIWYPKYMRSRIEHEDRQIRFINELLHRTKADNNLKDRETVIRQMYHKIEEHEHNKWRIRHGMEPRRVIW